MWRVCVSEHVTKKAQLSIDNFNLLHVVIFVDKVRDIFESRL